MRSNLSARAGSRAVILALVLAVVAGALAVELVSSNRLDSQRDDRITLAEDQISDSLADRTFFLQDVADMVGVHDDADQGEFARYAKVRGRLDPAVVAVQWIRGSPDGEFVPPATAPPAPVLVPAADQDKPLSHADDREEAEDAIRTASLEKTVASSPPIALSDGDSAFYIAVPIEARQFSGDVSSVESQSVIVGLVDASDLLGAAVDEGDDVSITDPAGDLAQVGEEQENPVTSTIDAHGRQWVVSVEGGARSPFDRALPWVILIAGLLLTAVIALLLGRAIQRRDEALAIARHRAEELERRSREDDLTGVFNRRHFGERLTLELGRGGEGVAVMLMDLDHFKRINDMHGHLAGDQVLQVASQRLSDSLRGSECLARWGGEEFAVLIPRIDREHALALAERLRAAMADAPIEVDGAPVTLTMSIGLALAADGLRTPDAIVDAADQALYDAKDAGRNAVRTWQPPDRAGAPG